MPACRNGARLCAVFATEGPLVGCPGNQMPGIHPLVISANIQTYIAGGLVQLVATPQPIPPDDAYVFLNRNSWSFNNELFK
ncbi:hypothetical protein [Pedobacter cryoconitis]|nr:hypothetical protein [Pedobacter cryoconitis]